MKAVVYKAFFSILSALLLLHFFLGFPSPSMVAGFTAEMPHQHRKLLQAAAAHRGFPSPSMEAGFTAEMPHHHRKLLQPAAAAAGVNLRGYHGALTKQPVVEVSASLRRLPPSKSNPSQNKKGN